MRDGRGYPIPQKVGTRQEMFAATPELLERGSWVCLNIEPTTSWPVHAQSFEFEGYPVWIIPLTTDHHPGVALQRPTGLSEDEAEAILCRLLSVISWQESSAITILYRSGGGMLHMMGLAKNMGFSLRKNFDFIDVLSSVEEKPRVALALMREARSLNHHGYAFLSYWRILELSFDRTSDRVTWMEEKLPSLNGYGIAEALASIGTLVPSDVCRHLKDSSRCAMAHAQFKPIINPDDPRDGRRLSTELPIVRELAIRAIEEQFGIETPTTQYQKHLYELRGWKEVLGLEIIERLLSGSPPKESEMLELPLINVRLSECQPYLPLENMKLASCSLRGNGLELRYNSSDNLIFIQFCLDFQNERLLFDLHNGLYGQDNGSILAAEYIRDVQRFRRDYELNGKLQMWDAESGKLLSRLDAFLPVNYCIDLESCNANIALAQAEIERRQPPLA